MADSSEDDDPGRPGQTNSRIGKLSELIPFMDVAKLLEKVSIADSNDKRKKSLQKFFDFYRCKFKEIHKTLDSDKAGGDSLYPIVRILIPDMDRGRSAYGFKSTALARMFVQILGIDKNSKDGKSLLNFKDPSKAGSSAGDLAGTVFKICETRFASRTIDNPLTLSEVHKLLDSLARDRGEETDVNQELQKKIVQSKIQRFTALEVKWLVRILLKEMRLGLSSTKATVYSLLHKDAKQLSDKIGNLELLCQNLNDPNINVSDIGGIALFFHFSPMLATRMDIIDSTYEAGGSLNNNSAETTDSVSKPSSKKTDIISLPAPPFYVETKWDGERFQIHYNGKEFRYFSRRGFDFTKKFNETLTPKLRGCICQATKSFILDGEMMAYHKEYKIFTQKGYNIDVKTMNANNPNHCPVFVAFDLVYFNGSNLLNINLHKRIDQMKAVFQPKDDVIRISEIKTMNRKEEVIACLDNAIADGEEGLIVKDRNSIYEPGKRGITWLKIKPEYLEDNAVDDLDLVILGAYYTESVRRGGEITHFLVGLIDNSKGREMYHPVAKVGSGRLRSASVKELVEELKPKFMKSLPGNINLRARKKPDFMIDPQKSIVVQVKASEIIPSDVYSLNFTLRFPRITHIRRDKRPQDIMTVEEFTRLRNACGGKLAQRTDGKPAKSNHPFSRKRRFHSAEENSDSDDGRPSRKKSPALSPTEEEEAEDDFNDPLPGPSSKLKSINKTKQLLPSKSPLKIVSPSKGAGPGAAIQQSPKKGTKIIKNIFNNKIFCIYGSSTWKLEMEAKIRQHGGEITQNPVNGLFAIIGEREKTVLISKAISSKKYDVLNSKWINESIENGNEIELSPLYFWGMTPNTKKSFKSKYDEYGDSYTKINTLEETKELVKRVMQFDHGGDNSSSSDSDSEISATKRPDKTQQIPRQQKQKDEDSSETEFEIEEKDFGQVSSSTKETQMLGVLFQDQDKSKVNWDFMKEVEIAFRGNVNPVLKCKLEFYGGKVSDDENSVGVTHIIVCNEGFPSKEDHCRALVVSQKWLEDCIDERKALDERLYLVK